MYTILKKEVFSPTTFLWEVLAPDIAHAARAGQFVMVHLNSYGERIPLTIADFDREKGTITLVVKVVGKTTEEMSTYAEGATFLDLVGPLGTPSLVEPLNHVVLVGGGIGIAPLLPILREFRETGSYVTVIVGFRTMGEIFWKARFEKLAHQLVLMTEDGSSGEKGTVIDGLKKILSEETPIEEVLAIGPIGMMQAVAETTRPWEIPTFVSMNPIMVDGIGMCGSCRVKVGDKILFACVDGPDMNGHLVDFKELKTRQIRFFNEEQRCLKAYHERQPPLTQGGSR
ncbi:MAG: sulfide/dihydroorotate dehydrogenase-like FAD/NAD-binding protein [Deltaproteobacteria bacterium]|nr:sulfide/dihydroorotate dehydrogenase-like FAD/NAD-binding protein [Deltaproteobacteria bacterium]